MERAGWIQGRVVDEASGEGILQVEIHVHDSNGRWVASTWPDASGRFSTTGLPSGQYFVATDSRIGHFNKVWNGIDCENSCPVTSGTLIGVTGGSVTTGIDFELRRGGTISGFVTDAVTGDALSSISVHIYDSAGVFQRSVGTDGIGSFFTSSGLATGTYFAKVESPEGYLDQLFSGIQCAGYCNPTIGTPLVVTEGQRLKGVNFALARGSAISGTVSDAATGASIPHATVEVFDELGIHIATSYTGSDGVYTTNTSLVGGTYFVRAYSEVGHYVELFEDHDCPNLSCDPLQGTPIVLPAGDTASGIDFELEQGGRISGVVTDSDSGAPVAPAYVHIHGSAGQYVMTATTGGDGRYISTFGLFPGDYFVQAGGPAGHIMKVFDNLSCPVGNCNLTDGTPVPVVGSSTTDGIDFLLELGGSISGSVLDAATLQRVSSRVYIYNGPGDRFGSAPVYPGGQFLLTGLPAGTYFARTVNYQHYLDQLYDSFTCSGCNPLDGTSIFIDKGQETSHVDFRLESGGGYISGTASDALSGEPLSEVWVSIYDQNGNWVTYGYTGEDGGYSIHGGLTSGIYYAVASYDWRGYLNEVYDDIVCVGTECASPLGTPIPVTFGLGTLEIDFALKLNLIFADGFEGGSTSQWASSE